MTMRLTSISTGSLRVLIVGWAVPLAAQQGPCEQITAACKSAGFAQGEAGSGKGLQADCIIPLMQGIAQPAAATLTLPHITPQVIAACKKNRPDFGQGKPAASSLAAGPSSAQGGIPSSQGGQPDIKKAPNTVTNVTTGNGTSGRQGEIDIPSMQVGASNPANTGSGTPKTAREGNDSTVVNEIDSSIGHHPAPTYTGPPIPLPPSGSAGTNSSGSLSAPPPPGFDVPVNKPRPSGADSTSAPRKFRLIVWTNDKPTALVGLSGATGPGGTALPTPAEVRAQAQMPQRPPGVVILHAQSGSPASRALSQLGACNAPACVVEIDKLGASGEVVQKYRFTGGQAVVRSGAGANPEESVSFTYGSLNVHYVPQVSGGTVDSASVGWNDIPQ
jgi:hypothetical protein